MLVMHTDADAAADEIGLIVSLAQQVDDLDAIAARRVRAEISVRIRALQAALLADERELQLHGHGDNHVPHALDEDGAGEVCVARVGTGSR